MILYSLMMYILVVFVAVPARIFMEIGLNPEEINTMFFFLVWLVIASIMYFVAKVLIEGVKLIYLKIAG